MLHGEHGPATKMAMSILRRMAEVAGAEELLDISGAHIDSTVYIGEAGLEFAERLANLGAKVCVPTTLNVSGVDEHHWQEWGIAMFHMVGITPEAPTLEIAFQGKKPVQSIEYAACGNSEPDDQLRKVRILFARVAEQENSVW